MMLLGGTKLWWEPQWQSCVTVVLPTRLQISPPVHFVQAWGASRAYGDPWSRCGDPYSLRSPSLQSSSPVDLSMRKSFRFHSTNRLTGSVISWVFRFSVGVFSGSGKFNVKHMWWEPHTRLCVLRETSWRGLNSGNFSDDLRTERNVSPLSASCTTTAPLPVGNNDDVHDSGLAMPVWEPS